MAIIGNPKSKNVKFVGFTVEIAEYIAQYLELTYFFKLYHVIFLQDFHFLFRIEYVPENPLNVAKYGLANVIINALVNKVNNQCFNNYLNAIYY